MLFMQSANGCLQLQSANFNLSNITPDPISSKSTFLAKSNLKLPMPFSAQPQINMPALILA